MKPLDISESLLVRNTSIRGSLTMMRPPRRPVKWRCLGDHFTYREGANTERNMGRSKKPIGSSPEYDAIIRAIGHLS